MADLRVRDELIASHYRLARIIAQQLASRLPNHVEIDELVSNGVLGLIDAADRFDAGRGVPFKAYAEIRIRGAIIDGIRHADWVPRDVRRRSGLVEQARNRLRNRLGTEPDREQIAAELRMSPDEYDALVQGAQILGLVSIDAPTESGREVQIASHEAPALDQEIARQDIAALMVAIQDLPERERLVATLYYLQGLQLTEIAEKLGVTGGRISQIRSRAVERLRAALGADETEGRR